MPHLAREGAQLATTPGLSIGDLVEASNSAPRNGIEAGDFLRAKARARMKGAGRIIDPRFDWDDFVAKPELIEKLKRIVFEARMWPALIENPETDRLFAGMAGISVLFSGPPGVGKSMAAQVIAHDLGVNILVVDLAATTSKYIGETAKNLSKVFAQAQAAGAALIFEEADAFFARRTEVKDSNDRHANTDTNHLLQLMEGHSGLVILSTNRRANIDPAFTRRLRHVVEFSKPGPVERKRLWTLMLAALGVDTTTLSEIIEQLADSHDLSPAQIKGATLSARYAALADERPVSAEDLTAGAVNELTKEGRSIPPRKNPRKRRNRSRING
jgi:SpoVK/Ycf46/Vps4 family AAA+-type ATPase